MTAEHAEDRLAGVPRKSNFGITLITPLKWWGPAWLRAQFRVTRMLPWLKHLAPFRSVYFSQWTILTRFHYNGPPQVRESPEHPYLLWEVAYSAEVDPYVESFVLGIEREINLLWGSSFGFPGTSSIKELRDYIDELAWPIGHMYWAYPEASVRMVESALLIAREHEFLLKAAHSRPGDDFGTTYNGFLQRRGMDL